MAALYREYGDRIQFYLVYVREAHPSDGRQTASNVREKIIYETPKSLADRAKIARDCVRKLGLDMPCLLDGMDNAVQKRYRGWPARACVVASDGTIAFASRPGPRGINPPEVRNALEELDPIRKGFRTQNPKPEYRNSKQIRNPKAQMSETKRRRSSLQFSFPVISPFRDSDLFRISGFGFRI